MSWRSGPVRSVSNVGAKSDEECAGRAERRGRMWEYGAVVTEASNGMSPDGGEAGIGEGKSRSRGLMVSGY